MGGWKFRIVYLVHKYYWSRLHVTDDVHFPRKPSHTLFFSHSEVKETSVSTYRALGLVSLAAENSWRRQRFLINTQRNVLLRNWDHRIRLERNSGYFYSCSPKVSKAANTPVCRAQVSLQHIKYTS